MRLSQRDSGTRVLLTCVPLTNIFLAFSAETLTPNITLGEGYPSPQRARCRLFIPQFAERLLQLVGQNAFLTPLEYMLKLLLLSMLRDKDVH